MYILRKRERAVTRAKARVCAERAVVRLEDASDNDDILSLDLENSMLVRHACLQAPYYVVNHKAQ